MKIPLYDSITKSSQEDIIYQDPMAYAAALPLVGYIVAAGAYCYLLESTGKERTSAPARARGTVITFIMSHIVYALIILISWVIA
jgi:hypothetical protein